MNVPVGSATATYEERRSKFISFAVYLEHPDDVKRLNRERRSESPGCNHVVWAFVWGADGERFGSNDDHEPKGSAGRPALDVLRGSGLTNTLVQIVRYFGGTKLGIGGLVRAYAEATRRVLDVLQREPLVVRMPFHVSVAYKWYQPMQTILAGCGALIQSTDFGTVVDVSGAVAEDEIAALKVRIDDLTNGTAIFDVTEH